MEYTTPAWIASLPVKLESTKSACPGCVASCSSGVSQCAGPRSPSTRTSSPSCPGRSGERKWAPSRMEPPCPRSPHFPGKGHLLGNRNCLWRHTHMHLCCPGLRKRILLQALRSCSGKSNSWIPNLRSIVGKTRLIPSRQRSYPQIRYFRRKTTSS